MLQVEEIPERPSPSILKGKQRDTIVMTAEELQWTRRRLKTTAGRELALALPTGVSLIPGSIIVIQQDWYLEVEAALEALIAVRPADRDSAVRVAFEIGNRHFPLALDGDRLLVPDDVAMVQLFDRLGVDWTRVNAPFDPIGRSHGHAH